MYLFTIMSLKDSNATVSLKTNITSNINSKDKLEIKKKWFFKWKCVPKLRCVFYLGAVK